MQHIKSLINSQKIDYKLIFFFFIFTRVFSILLTFPTVTDMYVYIGYFKNIYLDGLIPYLEFKLEYPPLSLIPIYIPGFFIKKINFYYYFLFFACMMFFIDFICLNLCKSYCKKRLNMTIEQIKYMMLIYSFFGLFLFRVLYHRLDIIVALLLTSSLLLFATQNKKITIKFWLNSLIGFFYKIVPAFLVPPAIIIKAYISSNSKKEFIIKVIKNSSIFLVVLILLILAIELIVGFEFLKNLSYHNQRGIQIESNYSSLLLFSNLIFDTTFILKSGYGSADVMSKSKIFEEFTRYFGHFCLLLFYFLFFLSLSKIKSKNKKIVKAENLFLDVTIITLLITITFQRVLSPQFFIWLIPVASIWLTQNRTTKNFSFLMLIFFTTHMVFSINYMSLLNQEPILVTTLFVRTLLLLYFTSSLVIQFFKKLTS